MENNSAECDKGPVTLGKAASKREQSDVHISFAEREQARPKVKAASKREQSDVHISFAEREQARPKVKAASKREQSDVHISFAEREQARPKVKTRCMLLAITASVWRESSSGLSSSDDTCKTPAVNGLSAGFMMNVFSSSALLYVVTAWQRHGHTSKRIKKTEKPSLPKSREIFILSCRARAQVPLLKFKKLTPVALIVC